MISGSAKLNTSNLNVKFEIQGWNQNPGQWIESQAQTPAEAQTLFKEFVTKQIPEAFDLITKLNDAKHLSPIHLSLPITSIFLIFITEQLEHYQNQRETRDVEVDQKFQQFKEVFAKERYHIRTLDPNWAKPFFDDLKSLLVKTDVLSEDFDKTISLWMRLISIAHVGDLYLASFFDSNAKTQNLSPKKKVCANLQRGKLEPSLRHLVRQLSLDLKWIALKLGDKMPFPEDPQLQFIFFAATNPLNLIKCLQEKKNYINATSVIQNDFKLLIRDLLSLDLTNNIVIKAYIVRLENILTHLRYYGDLSICVEQMRKVEIDNYKPIHCGPASNRIEVTKEMFPKLLSLTENRQECHLLIDCYLIAPCCTLVRMLEALITSNVGIEKFYKGGGIPPSNTQSLLPIPASQREKAVQALCNATPPERITKKKGRKNNKAPENLPKREEKKVSPSVDQSATPVLLEKPIEIPSIDPLEQLRRQLFTIHDIKPIISVRQALWHLDALISLHEALKVSPASPENNLAILNMASGSAHKLLEQAYRFCLEVRGIQPPTSHNLKEFHRAYDHSPYPDIVQELYMANHWTRYSYLENEKWSFSTQVVNIPPLLKDLVGAAEAMSLPNSPAIEQNVQKMIEKTRAHVEKILPKPDFSLAKGFLAEDVPIQLNFPLNLNCFNETKNCLSLFLAKTPLPYHHPAYLHLKQGIAAIAILKTSLQMIQKAKTPRELASWASLCTQQVQETVENILHAIEFFEKNEASSLHDLQKLSASLGLEMGPLADACHLLSYKSRYPAENLSDGLGAQIVDDVETLRQYPDCLSGFKMVGETPMLWKQPDKDLSLKGIMGKLTKLIEMTEGFLKTQALPALCKHQGS